MAEKTEEATPRKLREGRKKGQVAKSQDFPSAFTFVVAIGTVLSMTGHIYDSLAGFIVSCFSLANQDLDWSAATPSLMAHCAQLIFTVGLPIMLASLLVGVVINFLIVGPMWATQAMKFDLKRLNPVDNLKSKFKPKTLLELIKSILKISVAAYLVYGVVSESLSEILDTIHLDPLGAALVVKDLLLRVVIRVGIFFVAVAVADLVFQKRLFKKDMRMEKHEVKRDWKESEGDPHIKGKRKQIAQEIAYQDGAPVKRSKAVITNPQHIAVAIGYEADSAAPFVLAMGVGGAAKQIMRIAEEAGIPLVRDVTLARALHETAKVGQYIPEDLFEPMAEVLRMVFELYPELSPIQEPEIEI